MGLFDDVPDAVATSTSAAPVATGLFNDVPTTPKTAGLFDDVPDTKQYTDQLAGQVGSIQPMGTMDRLRINPVVRSLLGPTDIEREAMTEKPVTPKALVDTAFKFMTPPPIVAEPIKSVTGPAINLLPDAAAGITEGMRDAALEFPIAGAGLKFGDIAGKIMLRGFEADFATSLPDQYRSFKQELAAGNKRQAYYIATKALLTGAILGGAEVGGARQKANEMPSEQRAVADQAAIDALNPRNAQRESTMSPPQNVLMGDLNRQLAQRPGATVDAVQGQVMADAVQKQAAEAMIQQQAADRMANQAPAVEPPPIPAPLPVKPVEVATKPTEVSSKLAEPAPVESKPVENAPIAPQPAVAPEPTATKPVGAENAQTAKATAKRQGVERPWDIIDEIQSIGKIRNQKNSKPGSEGYYDGSYKNAASKSSARGIFDKNGMAPDKMVDELRRRGMLSQDATVRDMLDTISSHADQRTAIFTGQSPEAKQSKFWKLMDEQGKKKSAQVVSVGDLKIGSKFKMKGEDFVVKSIDPDTGEVTVEDGRKFGFQDIPDGADIPADSGTVKHPKVSAEFVPKDQLNAPEVKPVGPKLGQGQNQGDLIDSTQSEPLKLVQENVGDAARIAAEKQAAITAAADAKALQEKQQLDMFASPTAKPITAQEGGFPQGPGAKTYRASAKPDAPETSEGTGLKHAIDDLERTAYGFGERPKQDQQAMAKAWEDSGAVEKEKPLAGKQLADSLIANPRRGLTGDESALLLRHKVALENALNDAAEKTVTAKPADKMDARIEYDRLHEEFKTLLDAINTRGSEWGREGRWRQALAYEDYTFATQERRLVASKGGEPLTTLEHGQLLKDVAEHKALLEAEKKHSAAVEANQTKVVEEAVQKVVERYAKEAAKVPNIHPRILETAERIVVSMEKRGEAALIRAREKMSRMSAGIDPTLIIDWAEIGVGKLSRKAMDFTLWSKSMIETLGPKIEPFLQRVFDESKKLFDADLTRVHPNVSEQIKRTAKKSATAEDLKANTIEAIRTKVNSEKSGAALDLNSEIQRLARMFIAEGVRGRDNLINSVHSVVEGIKPDWTRRDTMDAISGYGDFKRLSKDEISVQLRDLKGQMQQVAKLEDMAAHQPPSKTGIERRQPSDEERMLIQLVNEAKKKGGYEVTDPETQLASAQSAKLTQLRNRIADIQHELLTKEKIVKQRNVMATTPEIEALKAEYKTLKIERDALFKTAVDAFKTRTAKRIAVLEAKSADLEAKLSAGEITAADIAPKVRKPVDMSQDPVAMELKAKLAVNEARFGKAQYQARQKLRTLPKKILDGINQTGSALGNIMASFDFSAPRQALGFLLTVPAKMITNPIRTTQLLARGFGRYFTTSFSEKQFQIVQQKVHNRPNALSGADKIMGIEYSSLDSHKFSKYEDAAHSVLDEWALLPIKTGNVAKTAVTLGPKLLSKGVRGSNRGFSAFLNTIRAGFADELLRTQFKDRTPTDIELRDVGYLVNLATGRGEMGVGMNRLQGIGIWSPNLLLSRVKTLSGAPFFHAGSTRTKAMITKEYAKALMGGYLLWQVKSMFDDKKEKDPASSDFGKIVRGNTRLDLWGGFQQVTVAGYRTGTATTTTLKGKTVSIGSNRTFGVTGPFGVALNLYRSKLRPDWAIMVNVFDRKDFIGRNTDITTEKGRSNVATSMIPIPLSISDIRAVMKDRGFTEAMIDEALSAFGAGLSVYEGVERQR